MKTLGAIWRVLATTWVLSTIVWIFWYQKGALGYRTYSSANGVPHVAADTSSTALVLSVVGLIIFGALPRIEAHIAHAQIAPLWRRYFALLVDFWFCVFTLANLSAIIPLVLKARHAGTLRWHFDRDYWVPADGIGDALILLSFVIIPAYFVLTLANRRQTLGCWLLRIATVNADGRAVFLPLSTALRRSYRDFVELSSPSTLWKIVRGKDVYGGTPYDREGGFKVVRY